MRIPTSLLLAACLFAQEDPPPIRVTSTLVQVDATVTGKDGRPVTGLTADDFELFVDGKPRPIAGVSYVKIDNPAASSLPPTPATQSIPRPLRREDVHRTVAIVVDDLKMSPESLHFTREALKKFVDKQIAPGDFVAILTTSGAGTLRQFSSDRRIHLATINSLRPNLHGGPASAIQAIGNAGDGDGTFVRSLLARRFAVGTLGAVRHIAQGMRNMPGRKSIVLFSEGMRMYRDFAKDEPPVDANEVRRVSDSANNSSVVIYTVDPRGVIYPGLNAADDVANLEQVEIMEQLKEREGKVRSTQNYLRYLAQETGGLAQLNSNDLNDGLRQVLDDQSGYYLIGFHPGEETAERLRKDGNYHRLRVKVKRPGLRIRHRLGFTGGNPEAPPDPRTGPERLLAALTSPFSSPDDIALRFTPVFATGPNNQPIVRALLHIGAKDLTFGPPDKEGYRAATIHMVAITEGDSPKGPANTEKSYTVRVKEDTMDRFVQGGFVYTLEHELKKPGAYQMRVAILDAASGRTGSASRFVEAPDLTRGSLTLAGLTMIDGDWRNPPSQEGSQDDLSPAIRVFQRGRTFSYGATAYNAPLDKTTGRPTLEFQPRLHRGDQVIWEGKRFPAVPIAGADPKHIRTGGILTLGPQTTPGDYVLELRAIQTGPNQATVSQWIDFELK